MGQNGGKRPGAGRPKGTENQSTIEKREARDYIRQRVRAELGPILDGQIASAKGIHHFFMRNKLGQFEQITDPKAIETALNAGEEGSYYWIFTKDPSTQAFTSLSDRAFDKPTEHVEHTGEDGEPIALRLIHEFPADGDDPDDTDPLQAP